MVELFSKKEKKVQGGRFERPYSYETGSLMVPWFINDLESSSKNLDF